MNKNTTACNMINDDINSLLLSLTNANISVSEISDILYQMNKMNEIKKKYADKIKTRKDGRQYYIYINRKQYTATSLDKLYTILYNLEYGRQNWSMADIFPLWLVWKRDNTSTVGKTLEINTQEWEKYFEPYALSHAPLKTLTSEDFTTLFRKWTKNRAMTLKKFNNLKSLINGLYRFSISELKIVDNNPIHDIEKNQFSFKPVNNDDDVFSILDREKILDYLSSDEDIYSLAIQFDFHVTLRIGELLSLKWSDISGNNIRIQRQLLKTVEMNDDLSFSKASYEVADHVKGNTSDGFRYLPLTSSAIAILEKVRKQNPNGTYIFMKDGDCLNAKTFNRHLTKHCENIGITPRTSHKIRFTVASMLHDNGMPITDLQKLLGHSTVEMTMRYLRKVTPKTSTASIMERCLG